jgi:hypothetical protein
MFIFTDSFRSVSKQYSGSKSVDDLSESGLMQSEDTMRSFNSTGLSSNFEKSSERFLQQQVRLS